MKINKEQFNELMRGLETRKRDNGDEFICCKDGLSPEVKDVLHKIVMERDDHDFDLSYKIVDYALDQLDVYEYETIINDDFDVYDDFTEAASVYTAERLSYLTVWNEEEVSEYLYNGSISEACAEWFDNQVRDTMSSIINAIKED